MALPENYPAMQNSVVLDAKRAAAYVDTTPGWLAKMRMRGSGPVYLKLGRKVRYLKSDLDA